MVPLRNPGPSFGDAKCLTLNLHVSLSPLSKLGTLGALRNPLNGYPWLLLRFDGDSWSRIADRHL